MAADTDRPGRAESSAAAAAFNTVLSARAIRSAYQPVVRSRDGTIIGFEALARGPQRTVWHSPDALVDYAAKVRRLPELDWICRAAACRGALRAEFPANLRLFINIEPASARSLCPVDLQGIIATAPQQLRLVAEVTERAIADDPPALLKVVEQLRGEGYEIALDDVGAVPESLRMIEDIRPDVVKFDKNIVQDPESATARDVIRWSQRYADATGAVLLAEGVETDRHLATARRIGATYAQGYLFGRPSRLPRSFEFTNKTEVVDTPGTARPLAAQ
jgi:EAL domain-containing protein (putative c-di-GMP-specific phosphodiesterase class I)